MQKCLRRFVIIIFVMIVGGLLLIGCSADTKPEKMPAAKVLANPTKAVSKPSDLKGKIRVNILHLGDTIVDDATVFAPEKKPLNPFFFLGIFRSKEHQLTLPITAYLIEHPKGKILIDTGFNKTVRTDPVEELTRLHYMVNKPVQSPGEAVDEVLAAMGVKPSDLDYVILSHLHTDHVSGLKLVKDAKNILVSEEELAYASNEKTKYVHHMWKGVNLKTFKMSSSTYGPMKKSYDVFGDGSVILVYLPGHTPGLVGALIQNNGKFLILTADCGYARKSWEQMIFPYWVTTKEEIVKSFEWLKEMSKKDNCIDIFANHETNLKIRVIEF